jgi:hypothetical protein
VDECKPLPMAPGSNTAAPMRAVKVEAAARPDAAAAAARRLARISATASSQARAQYKMELFVWW